MSDPAPTPFDTLPLRQALGGFATGVCIITANSPRGPLGITVNSFTSVSLQPPTVMWSLGRRSDRWPTFSTADHFAVHVLAADGEATSARFAWGDSTIRDGEFEPGLGGAPLLDGWVSRFQCRTVRRLEAEDHLLIFGEIEAFETRAGDGLVFYRGQYLPVKGPAT